MKTIDLGILCPVCLGTTLVLTASTTRNYIGDIEPDQGDVWRCSEGHAGTLDTDVEGYVLVADEQLEKELV